MVVFFSRKNISRLFSSIVNSVCGLVCDLKVFGSVCSSEVDSMMFIDRLIMCLIIFDSSVKENIVVVVMLIMLVRVVVSRMEMSVELMMDFG